MSELASARPNLLTHLEPTAEPRECAAALFQRYGGDARMFVVGRMFDATHAGEPTTQRFWRGVYDVLDALVKAWDSANAVSDVREIELDPTQEVERWAAYVFKQYGEAAGPYCGSLIFQHMQSGDRRLEMFWRDVGIRLLDYQIDPAEAQQIGAVVH